MNLMQQVRMAKLTLNFGAGKDQTKLEKGIQLLKSLTGVTPVKTITQKRIPSWGVRPGLPVGCMVTLRKQPAVDLLKRLLEAKENKLKMTMFDHEGNVGFGIPESIDIPDYKYDPKVGVLGLQVCVTLEKPGFRVKRRKLMPAKIPHKHRVSRDEAAQYMKDNFGVIIE